MADKKTQLMAQFYVTCRRKGYTDMTDPAQSLKAKVIATDLNLNYGNIVDFYKKSEQCFEIVRRENVENERLRLIRQEREDREKARKAVDGTLLVTIKDVREKNVLDVFIRPDESIYCKFNGGEKIEGAPTVTVKRGGVLMTSYHPSKAVYTGATVGGITTGGVHYTEDYYTQKVSQSEKGYIDVQIGDVNFTVDIIVPSTYSEQRFCRDGDYLRLVTDGKIRCYQDSAISKNYAQYAMTGVKDYMSRMDILSMAAEERRIPMSLCVKINTLLGRIVNGEFPPTDEEIYAAAMELSKSKSAAELKKAVDLFNKISDYSDSARRATLVEKIYEEVLQAEKETAILKKEASKRRTRRTVIVCSTIVGIVLAVVLLLTVVILPSNNYKKAEQFLANGDVFHAAVAYYKANGYKDSDERSMDLWKQITQRETISACDDLTVGLKSDGTVVAVGSPEYARDELSSWTNIVAISTGGKHIVGLKSNGTVVANGMSYSDKECDLKDWSDIVAISAGKKHTVGLKADGTVVVAGYNKAGECDTKGWSDIVAISAGDYHTVGLKADGTVVATKYTGDANTGFPYFGECDVESWTNIVAISTSDSHTVGLKADGTVVAVGYDFAGQCDVESWTDIVAIYAGNGHTVGLKADGTVIATEYTASETFYDGECDVDDWTGIVAICAGGNHTVGVKADGSVIGIGSNVLGQLDIWNWTNMMLPD